MKVSALVNASVLLETGFERDAAVVIEDNRILNVIRPSDVPAGVERVDLDGAMLVPGFVDIQVNGGGGVLFNDAPTVETIAAIGAAHRRFGTTGFLPTLISDDLTVVHEGVRAVDAAIEAGVPGVLGIHIEGPFLNVERRGIHDAARIRDLDEAGFEAITGLKRGRTLVTLAPERTTAEMRRRLVRAGVIVAAGHTNATYAQTWEGLRSGVTGFTHLFNAMSPLGSREPGAVGAALEDRHSWCSLIVDGRHVAPATMRMALRSKPIDRFLLVTDAMPPVGTDETSFMLQGQEIRVEDGVCVNADGTLAGSALDMATAVRNAVEMLEVDIETALRMASRHPADFIEVGGLYGRIMQGLAASLVALDDRLQVVRTWIDGSEASPA